MEHDKYKENLSAYMDGELKGEELKALEAHLAACNDCARDLAGLRKVSALVKKHAPEAVPQALKEAVFSGLEKPAASAWLKPGIVFAAAAAALLVVFALPKFWGDRSVFSPQLFQNSYYEPGSAALQGGFGFRAGGGGTLEESAAPASAEGKADAGPNPAYFSGQGAAAGGPLAEPQAAEKKEAAPEAPAAAPRYTVPAFRKTGALAMAKAAGLAAGEKAVKKDADIGGQFASLSGAGSAMRGAAAASFAGEASAPGNMPAAEPAAPKAAALPGWLEKLILGYKAGPAGDPPYEIWRYSYKGRTVYFLPEQCCDQFSALYDENGAKLCAPDGGFAGAGDGRCADFHAAKKGGELVWKDHR